MQAQTSLAPHWKSVASTTFASVLKTERLGLVTDMDGTISHISDTPEATVVTPRNRQLLGTMVLMLPLVAAISGRSARDLQARVAIPGMVYIGNHGLERWQNGGRVMNEHVREYRKALVSALDELRPRLRVGMWIEDKYATASLHYRLTPKPDLAAQELEPLVKDICNRYGLKANVGRRLFEIRPPIEANKGTALAELIEENHLDGVIYIGDDLTDIDAMKTAQRLRESRDCQTINIGVISGDQGPDPEISKAVQAVSDLRVNDVNDVEELLSWLLNALSRERI